MHKFWFVSENGYPVSIFNDRQDAILERNALAGLDALFSCHVYGLAVEEIIEDDDDYEDERTLAEEAGFI